MSWDRKREQDRGVLNENPVALFSWILGDRGGIGVPRAPFAGCSRERVPGRNGGVRGSNLGVLSGPGGFGQGGVAKKQMCATFFSIATKKTDPPPGGSWSFWPLRLFFVSFRALSAVGSTGSALVVRSSFGLCARARRRGLCCAACTLELGVSVLEDPWTTCVLRNSSRPAVEPASWVPRTSSRS